MHAIGSGKETLTTLSCTVLGSGALAMYSQVHPGGDTITTIKLELQNVLQTQKQAGARGKK